ncbi:hypothetical protein Sjap_010590 [Stephania japonica]|uniref:JmjC domain-containing protein n=1 Tax=Stephania japonica TaxID=461633 RepID=A0AAP0P4A9_9MAGN
MTVKRRPFRTLGFNGVARTRFLLFTPSLSSALARVASVCVGYAWLWGLKLLWFLKALKVLKALILVLCEEMMRDRRGEALGALRALPDDLICAILETLSPRDLARLACASSDPLAPITLALIPCRSPWTRRVLGCNDLASLVVKMVQTQKHLIFPLVYRFIELALILPMETATVERVFLAMNIIMTRLQNKIDDKWLNDLVCNVHIMQRRTVVDDTLPKQNVAEKFLEACTKSLHFDGFNSLFLYRRFYRCFTTLSDFSLDHFAVERVKDLSLQEFQDKYDGKKPVLVTGLAETWPARHTWTTDQLVDKYGDLKFKISQRSSKKITMKLKDYVSYMKLQRDEDPLYIFDDKFGEVAPSLLNDYSVPHIFKEDFFNVLDIDQRPAFRWLIIGPERSGASWHVDPALTGAWNTLLRGRKRWALYPPGRVPPGVTVHVNEENGDVNADTPSSLQDKPIECTQAPGETIFVPSGWWHCVLNLENTIAVTQNFVNSKNFEFVCLDMTPGHLHKGVCRAGLLAVDNKFFENAERSTLDDDSQLSYANMERKEKRLRVSPPGEDQLITVNGENSANSALENCNDPQIREFSYEIGFLSMFLDEDRDHYNAEWSPSNSIGQREMRQWLHKLWVGKPEIRELIWKGACLSLNVDKWAARMNQICISHDLPSPLDSEKFPVGTGSNPVYLNEDYVIKIYVERGLESSLHGLGTELEFYSLLQKVNSQLKDHIPVVLASGILFQENDSLGTVPWDGKGIPEVVSNCEFIEDKKNHIDGYSFGVWSKKHLECKRAGMPLNQSTSSIGSTRIWPYMITKRCKGDIFAELRDVISWDDVQNLASFLGEQLRNLHALPVPSFHEFSYERKTSDAKIPSLKSCPKALNGGASIIPVEWQLFVETFTKRKKDLSSRLVKWGDPIPSTLIEKVEEYIPEDLSMLLNIVQDEKSMCKVFKSCSWIHSDIMDDNVYMEPCSVSSFPDGDVPVSGLLNGHNGNLGQRKWRPSYILDFSDLYIGDPVCDLIPVHLDVFRGDSQLLKKFLENYKRPLIRKSLHSQPANGGNKFERLSYHAMCYCILHEDNVLGSIFSLWRELRTAQSWEEVEEAVWGELNNYKLTADQIEFFFLSITKA